MSIFTNNAANATEQGPAYAAAIRDLASGRDALMVLPHTPRALEDAVAAISPPLRTRPEREGKWSVAHVVQHLADAEVAMGWRLRMMLAHERPTLTPWDQDLWAGRLRYDAIPVGEALADFAAARAANLRMIARMAPADLERTGLHAEWGEVSVRYMLEMEAGHDLLHLRQIERIRRAVEGGA